MSVPWEKASKLPDVASRASAYGITGEVVDGMDVLEVREAVSRAVEKARTGGGPSIVEAKTYRYYGHSHSDPRAYRTKEEEAAWKGRDPIEVLKQDMLSVHMITEPEFETMEKAVEVKLDQAMAYSDASPEPAASEVDTDVYAPLKTNQADIEKEAALRERVRNDKSMRQITYAQALVEAAREEMIRDPKVFIMGEDVGLYGGAYGATRGLMQEFGEWRVIDTPISEATIGGAAVGAAMAGLRPIAEIMYVDFTPLSRVSAVRGRSDRFSKRNVCQGVQNDRKSRKVRTPQSKAPGNARKFAFCQAERQFWTGPQKQTA
jgi:2-oxoisovalerate dehydrogenase E1 component